MEKTDQKIDELLLEAMSREIKAKEFYENASDKAQSSAGKKLFKELSVFEQNHYNKVKKIIEDRTKGIQIEKQEITQHHSSIRSEIEGEIEPNKNEIVEVLNLAIEAEKNAQELYWKISELYEEEEGKNIFSNLAQDERNHQKILEDEIYHLSNKGTIIWE
jgi:rubrerythrin